MGDRDRRQRPHHHLAGGDRAGEVALPCSKEISDYGAHNQRSLVTIRAELLQPTLAEQVRFAEESASSNSGRCSSVPMRNG
ncbi:MAG: GTP cyclohydrolase, FolE2/MptA family [Inhella sp.]